eukprot:Gregarina_sp_Pseudo_9__5755@NODE_848_length_2137_cov_94_393708_g796_i0_p1_GENE_NODE_848_length_2137_cov_94_393708_g796_i0NODE_848_length_2137_cov_94_393708_g796_i0_p1_ORF_typecomplete_len516_score65_45IMPDH/PF00478_25/2_8e142FMN_dh/PF01070_18/1_8e14FMN_dh/PF01070_18/18NMO/PF03060_15/0_00017NMO/PF03060_15/0_38NMO/PF03060_15/1_7e08CBS/PF00571_28/2_3e05CBS/PF00571_28/0_00017NanE/PF04131_14/3e03NanE/PF04131_14/7e11PcrB/PF01884_17/0_0066PcrB/PF01884_17/0_0015ThiG/PF05690_14/0_37ThiG/PF05690_14/0_0002
MGSIIGPKPTMNRVVQEGLTFDDVLLLPAHSIVLPEAARLNTRLTNSLPLNIPMVSAAMDTVTESDMAIALAKEGGIGFIHKSMTVAAQAAEVRKVKKYEAGVISDCDFVSPTTTVGEVKVMAQKGGYSSYPVCEKDKVVLGLVTGRDLKYSFDDSASVASIMTPFEKLVTVTRSRSVPENIAPANVMSSTIPFTRNEIRELMVKNRVEKIVVIDEHQHLEGLITWRDFEKSEAQPNACRDAQGCLRVGAAVGCTADTMDRVIALVDAGVDVVLVDSSHGHSEGVLRTIRIIRQAYPSLPIIGGNVATAEGALAIADAGADGVKVGIGPGSICTTRVVTGVGCPQFTAICNAVEALKSRNIPVIADGGIRYSGDISKALAAGASCVMVGSMFAGTDEAPGEQVLLDGRTYKTYRGMGSLAAMSKGSSDRYFQGKDSKKFVPEGVEGLVSYKGPLKSTIYMQMGGLRSCMGLVGCATIDELRVKPKFVKISPAGTQENHPHSILMTKEPANYTKRN